MWERGYVKMWCRWCRWSSARSAGNVQGNFLVSRNPQNYRHVLPIQRYKSVQQVRLLSDVSNTDIRSSFIPFDKFISDKRNQAKKSVLIQVNSEKSATDLHTYCSQYGSILGIHHYTVDNRHFMLVEYENDEQVSHLLDSATYSEDVGEMVPVKSPFLWFRANKKTDITKYIDKSECISKYKLETINGCHGPSEKSVINMLLKSNNVSEQIQSLYDLTHLNDISIRLRYIAARQIESSLIGMFPNISVHPFGSTINGFGKLGCDLDLVLKLKDENVEDVLDSRLVFHTKKSSLSGRPQQQRYLEIITDLIYQFAPGCSHVRKILQARIPIVKYNHDYTGLDCDLSLNSLSGLYMSELLYIYGCFDRRVRPLVFTIRKWAHYVGLTNSAPGKWITNFPLTLMVLFFLQNAPDGPLLPSLDYLRSLACKKDVRITDDHVDCTFRRDIGNISFKTENNANLETLLYQFFEFYSVFDFSSLAISLNKGKEVKKQDFSPLYIVNPLETKLNVSKNVSHDEINKIKIELRSATWSLETFNNADDPKIPWGLGALFKSDSVAVNKKIAELTRILSVKDLFVGDTKVNVDTDASNSGKDFDGSEEMHKEQFYKNQSVKNEVNSIRKNTAEAVNRIGTLYDSDDNKNGFDRRKFKR